MTISFNYPVKEKAVPTFYFIGVTTGQSSIRKVFPRWMEILGRPEIILEGIDHPLNDDPENYRRTVAQIKLDPLSLGGLVTSHKINLLSAARDMFDDLHDSSCYLGETSCISKKKGRLTAHAKDVISGGISLDAILGKDYFAHTGGEVLCFGAGGSGKALSLHLIQKTNPGDKPQKITLTNRSQAKLTALADMADHMETDIRFELIQNSDAQVNDRIMAGLPEYSVIINATGMGKDLPGSPISDQGIFPPHSRVWEINYRGELDFWHQAKSQETTRDLVIHDGWLYFLHGWTQVIAEVLDIQLDQELFNALADAAEDLRPDLKYIPR
jgi:shikimate 5-dehydrogenase